MTSAKRSQAVPDLPTVGETVPGYASVSWSAIVAPKGLPKDIVVRWNEEINRVLQMPDVKERMTASGLDIVGGTPAYLRKVIDQDIATWTKVVKAADIKVN